MNTFAIIGLGSFGYYLSKSLTDLGKEVLAVDTDEAAIERVKGWVQRAVITDSTNPDALKALGVVEYDAVIVSLGENIEASVLTTLNLKDLGVRYIVARAITEAHGRLLGKVGANDVVFPRRDMADRLALRLINADILEFVPLGSDYGILESVPSPEMVGRTLGELNFRKHYNLTVIVVRQLVPDEIIVSPDGSFVVKDSDILVLLGHNKDLEKLHDQ
jgi:trk system potassium uptake protein TrkA